MGDNAFENMTANLLAMDARVERRNSIPPAEYEVWKREFTFEGIKGARYGQSFCNHFDITDNRIFYERDWARCDKLIRKEWLSRP